jgi:hypothetical protein
MLLPDVMILAVLWRKGILVCFVPPIRQHGSCGGPTDSHSRGPASDAPAALPGISFLSEMYECNARRCICCRIPHVAFDGLLFNDSHSQCDTVTICIRTWVGSFRHPNPSWQDNWQSLGDDFVLCWHYDFIIKGYPLSALSLQHFSSHNTFQTITCWSTICAHTMYQLTYYSAVLCY